MSFRLADLKKSVRKGKESYQVTVTRIEGRPYLFRVQFILQQLEQHLGTTRRTMDPASLLDVMGDARLGRAMLATVSQWYRLRPRGFEEALQGAPGAVYCLSRLADHDIRGPADLRAFLFAAANRELNGFLDPPLAGPFWRRQSDALGVGEDEIRLLGALDAAEEWILVRTGPRPAPADLVAAYQARAYTTLLRSAREVTLHGAGRLRWSDLLVSTVRPCDVEGQVEGNSLRLFGKTDAVGSWTRQGRRVERAVLEVLSEPGAAVSEISGRVDVAGRDCSFHFKGDLIGLLTPRGLPGSPPPAQVDGLAAAIRRSRERDSGWRIRRGSHLAAVEGALFLPHFEMRRGDEVLFLRVVREPIDPSGLQPFENRLYGGALYPEADSVTCFLPGSAPIECPVDDLLPALAAWIDSRPSAQRLPAPRHRTLPDHGFRAAA